MPNEHCSSALARNTPQGEKFMVVSVAEPVMFPATPLFCDDVQVALKLHDGPTSEFSTRTCGSITQVLSGLSWAITERPLSQKLAMSSSLLAGCSRYTR